MPKLKMYVQVEIRDKNGNLVRKTKKKLCRSYVRQMIDLLRHQMSQASLDAKDTGGTTRTGAVNASSLGVNATAGTSTYGIQVGTGNTTVTISDFQLSALKAHSAVAPIFLYGAVSIGVVAVVGSTASFTIARTFTNQTGASIDFKEVGLVGLALSTLYKFLLERSLLEFTIANGESGTVTYTISVTV